MTDIPIRRRTPDERAAYAAEHPEIPVLDLNAEDQAAEGLRYAQAVAGWRTPSTDDRTSDQGVEYPGFAKLQLAEPGNLGGYFAVWACPMCAAIIANVESHVAWHQQPSSDAVRIQRMLISRPGPPDPTDPTDLRVPSFERVSNIDFGDDEAELESSAGYARELLGDQVVDDLLAASEWTCGCPPGSPGCQRNPATNQAGHLYGGGSTANTDRRADQEAADRAARARQLAANGGTSIEQP